MSNGLVSLEENNPYAKILMRTLGMSIPPYRNDEINVVLRSH